MGRRDSLIILVASALFVAPTALAAEPTSEPAASEETLDIGYIERVDSSLIEVPLVLTGRGPLHRSFDAQLEVWVGDQRMKGFKVELDRGRAILFGPPADDPLVVLPAGKRRGGATPTQSAQVAPKGRSCEGGDADPPNNRDRLVTISPPPRHPGLMEIPVPGGPFVNAQYSGPLNYRNTSMGVLSLTQVPRTPALRIVSPTKFLRVQAASYGYTGQGRSPNIQAALVPTGFERGSHEALAQVSIPDPGQRPGAWLVTLSIRSGAVTSVVWGRVESVGGEGRVVLQDTLDLPSGDYTMVAQAYHVKTGELREQVFEGRLEKPSRKHASFGPVAAFQKGGATVLKAGHEPNPEGAFALMPGDTLSPSRESALLVTLCGNSAEDAPWTVERSLVGPTATDFPETQVEPGNRRCVLLADRIPADSLEQGRYAYSIRISDSEGEVTEQSSHWSVADPDPGVMAASQR